MRYSGSKTEILLAARCVPASDDDRFALTALSGALPQAGVAARLWRPFEDSLADSRCLHLFGTAAEFLPVVEFAREIRARSCCRPNPGKSGLIPAPIPAGGCKNQQLGSEDGRGFFSRTPAWQRELYAAVDLLLPNSNSEAQQIARRFKLPPDRLRVIPHGVDPRLAEADPEIFRRHAGMRDFVLYAGTIEPNNQQLGFLWAMKNVDEPLIILGDVAPQCDWYLDECRWVAGPRVQFLPRLAANDPKLASACGLWMSGRGKRRCRTGANCSGGRPSGTPLVLYEGGCGSEYFGQQAVYVRPDDVVGIRGGVQAALDRKTSRNLAEHVCTYFSWKAVARTLRDAYGQVLHCSRAACPRRGCKRQGIRRFGALLDIRDGP